jgi:hypothetical protein
MELDTRVNSRHYSHQIFVRTWNVDTATRILYMAPQRHKAIMWILAHLVNCHMQGQRRKSLLDYIDFMRRVRWKADSRPNRHTNVGNYLIILDPSSSRRTHTPQARRTLGWLPLEVIDTLSAVWPARRKMYSHRLIYILSYMFCAWPTDLDPAWNI